MNNQRTLDELYNDCRRFLTYPEVRRTLNPVSLVAINKRLDAIMLSEADQDQARADLTEIRSQLRPADVAAFEEAINV